MSASLASAGFIASTDTHIAAAGEVEENNYGTSGTRIGLRLFGGVEFDEDICGQADLVEQAYRHGVPMGGELSAPDSARQDPMAAPLQRIQIIKGWVDATGKSAEAVYDLARVPGQAAVNLSTCQRSGEGAAMMCVHWQDPDYDALQTAWYYAWVVENPSCRWQTWQCLSEDIACDDGAPTTIQESAWSSPIWVRPAVAKP